MTDIHDIQPVLYIAGPWARWMGVIAGLLLLAVLAWWLHRRRGKAREAADRHPPGPADQALALLDAVAREADGKTFYFRLSAILRGYIEQRFGIAAAEMTLEELLPCIDRLPLPVDLARRLESLCRTAEPIKFAAAPADPDRMAEDLNFARTFVQRTAAAQMIDEDS